MAKARKKAATRARSRRPAAPSPAARWNDPEGREAWIEGLEESLAGVAFLDRDLELDGRVTAELAGVDEAGRIVLLALSDGKGDEVPRVAELLAFARRHARVLARHLGEARVLPELPPRVVLVLDSKEEPSAWRLAPFLDQGLELLCLRTIRSAGRERIYLVPADVQAGLGVALLGDARAGFLDGFEPATSALAGALLERLERLDEELEATLSRRAAVLRFRGRELLRLVNRGGRLEAELAADPARRPLVDAEDLEHLLDDLMEALLAAAGVPEPGSAPFPSGPAATWADPAPAAILTPEEIEAFRD